MLVALNSHARVALQNGIALNVVIDNARQLMVACTQHRVSLFKLKYAILVQRTFEDLACFLSFALYHEYYAQDVVRLEGVTELI